LDFVRHGWSPPHVSFAQLFYVSYCVVDAILVLSHIKIPNQFNSLKRKILQCSFLSNSFFSLKTKQLIWNISLWRKINKNKISCWKNWYIWISFYILMYQNACATSILMGVQLCKNLNWWEIHDIFSLSDKYNC
jgi:hypothetical protein